jgi:hypothetical protein
MDNVVFANIFLYYKTDKIIGFVVILYEVFYENLGDE